MAGIVYVVSNAAMPGLVKIGSTSKDKIWDRMNELYDASVPFPFECELAIEVDDEKDVEQKLHHELTHYSVNQKKEFFQECVIELIFDLMRNELAIAFEHITPFDYKVRENVGTSEAWEAADRWRGR